MKLVWLVASLIFMAGIGSAYSAADLTAKYALGEMPAYRIMLATTTGAGILNTFEIRTTFPIDNKNENLAMLVVSRGSYSQDAVLNYTCGTESKSVLLRGQGTSLGTPSWLLTPHWAFVVVDMPRAIVGGAGGIASTMTTFTDNEENLFITNPNAYGQSCAVISDNELDIFAMVFPSVDIQGEESLFTVPNEAMERLTSQSQGTMESVVDTVNLGFVVFTTLLIVFMFVFLWKAFEYIVNRVKPRY
jgi:hypothetical protein